jgi:hypothetical protein
MTSKDVHFEIIPFLGSATTFTSLTDYVEISIIRVRSNIMVAKQWIRICFKETNVTSKTVVCHVAHENRTQN